MEKKSGGDKLPKIEVELPKGTHRLLQALSRLYAGREMGSFHRMAAIAAKERYPSETSDEEEKEIFERAMRHFYALMVEDGLLVNLRRAYNEQGLLGRRQWKEIASDLVRSNLDEWVEQRLKRLDPAVWFAL